LPIHEPHGGIARNAASSYTSHWISDRPVADDASGMFYLAGRALACAVPSPGEPVPAFRMDIPVCDGIAPVVERQSILRAGSLSGSSGHRGASSGGNFPDPPLGPVCGDRIYPSYRNTHDPCTTPHLGTGKTGRILPFCGARPDGHSPMGRPAGPRP